MAADLHWSKFGFRQLSEPQELFANRTAGDVESDIAFEVRPPETSDDIGQNRLGGLMETARAFIVESNYALAERAGNKDNLLLGIAKASDDEHCIA